MEEFIITTESCLGYHCNGVGEYAEGEGSVWLDEEQVENLINLIRENSGVTDIEVLELEEKYPDIYEALDEAYKEAAYEAVYKQWLLNGYDCGYYDEPEGFMEAIEADGLFEYEPDLEALREDLGLEEDEEIDEEDLEEDKNEAFCEWLDAYVAGLDDDGKVDFIETYYGYELVDIDARDLDYTVVIPQEIVERAKKSDDN